MFDVYLCLTTRHDWRLAALALLVCAVGSASAMFLYGKTPARPAPRRWAWVALVGVVAGADIWATHFVAMLAFRAAVPAGYAAGGAVVSLLVAIASAAVAFALASAPGTRRGRLARRVLGGAVLGLGVSAMHYVGMSAYRPMGFLVWRPVYVAASVLLGVALSAAAMASAAPGSGRVRRAAGAALLMAAIGALHFTGMTAFWIMPDPAVQVPPALISQVLMACSVAAVTLVLIAAAIGGTAFSALARTRDLQRLSEALDSMSDGLAFFDADDRLVAWNSQYARSRRGGPLQQGQTFAEILRQGIDSGHYPEAFARREAWIAARLAARGRSDEPIEMRTVDGRWIRVRDRRTVAGGVITVFSDVTEQKEAEIAMARARDLAQEADRIKSEFLANMSHEIRTPMNGIIGMNSLLLMTALTPEQRRYAEVVRASADDLMAMINDILDVARLEAGQVEMDSAVFRMDALLREVQAEIAPAAAEKGLELAFAMEPAALGPVLGDPARLRQVLAHLLANAVKFTDSGEVRLELSGREAEPGRTWMRIEVIDTGIGVRPELKGKLFEPFRQADGSTTRRYGGAGLGLAICRHAVRLMGGAIGVADRDGGGSVFWLEVTLRNARPAALSDAA